MGLCGAHYQRNRKHGTPTGGSTGMMQAREFFKNAMYFSGNDCLIWPFGKIGGYAAMWSNGTMKIASNIMCEVTHGVSPGPDWQAAHSCGKGNRGCINPNHLRWATCRENQADRIRHGTTNRGDRQGRSKLTMNDVAKIKAIGSSISQQSIAELFGVCRATISAILRGKIWSHIMSEPDDAADAATAPLVEAFAAE
jgi:hypothetical protein